LDGQDSTSIADVLDISAGGTLVSGLNIINFPNANAIDLNTGGDNSIQGNSFSNVYNGIIDDNSAGNVIGTESPNDISAAQYATAFEGTVALGNFVERNTLRGLIGVEMALGAQANVIGGTPSSQNFISKVVMDGASDNNVSWNNIGIDNENMPINLVGDGVTIADGASDNQVTSNAIDFSPRNGITITDPGTTGNRVNGNDILNNAQDGILIQKGANNNQIGFFQGNRIHNNGSDGICITDAQTTGNLIQQNYVGTDFFGTSAAGNGQDGILISNGANGNTIGGASFVNPVTHQLNGAGNVISANLDAGVRLLQSSDNLIQGNFIGTDATGKNPLPNDPSGTLADGLDLLDGCANNTIGGDSSVDSNGTLAGTGNLISGNGFDGVFLADYFAAGSPVTSNVIQGNFIGVDVTGENGLPNAGSGVHLEGGASQNTIGGTGNSRNVISDNGSNSAHSKYPIIGAGVQIAAFFGYGPVQGNSVEGNIIGLDAAGTKKLGNLINGVALQHGVTANQIGLSGAGNIISGNVGRGVLVSDPGTDDNMIQGNYIGTDPSGKQNQGNAFSGVLVQNGAANTEIGGVGEGNVISGNGHNGILITDSATTSTVVQGNLIGVDVSGFLPLGNGVSGIYVFNSAHETLIGTDGIGINDAGKRNVISGNLNDGITIESAFDTTVAGNYIGTNANSSGTLPNSDSGVYVLNSQHTRIGTNADGVDDAAEGNILSGNVMSGVTIDGSAATANTVAGNYIGTDPSHNLALGNTAAGVRIINGANGNTIGGSTPVAGNLIVNNGKGVFVGSSAFDLATVDNAILFNRIFSNSGLGIDLGNDSVTPNTPNSPHLGPNDFTSFPVIALAGASGGSTFIQATLNAAPNTDYTVQIFANDAAGPLNHGQGKWLMASLSNIMSDGQGNAMFTTTIASNLLGSYLSATATDAAGNTSEFGADVAVTALAPVVIANTITAIEEAPFTSIVASFVDPSSSSASSYTAIVAWGDGTSSQGTVQASGNGFNVVASHTYAEEGGPFTVATTITDAPGGSSSASAAATVNDAVLTATPRTVNFSEAASATQVVASFQDANPSAFAGQFTATIVWGDGTPNSTGTISADGTGFDVTGTHAYATKGSYPIQVKIQDAGTATVANSTAVVTPPPLQGIPRSFNWFSTVHFCIYCPSKGL
jgi:titin